jgi:MFS family permease
LVLLFGAMYFVQGIAEPTEGLIAQPVRSLLKSWGYSAAGIAGFGALLALPWSLKPLYGLLTDFVPIGRTRRRSYLLLTSAASVLGLGCLYFIPVPFGAYRQLLFLLLIPTVGVAFSDVVVDALMIEKGQPRGLTGMLQSVQWAAMYGGSILAGLVGGYLSHRGHQQIGFLMCAVTSFATLLLAWFYVREEPHVPEIGRLRFATKELAGAARTPAVRAAAAFLFLWSFNPFSMTVLYMYMTEELGISEQFYGVTISLLSVGAIVGSLAYGAYCRRVPMRWLIHLSIATGVLSTLAYCCVTGQISAAVVSFVVGATYMTGSMVQYDLAARACPVAAAGTTFAMLMALSNLSLSASTALGGWLYDAWTARWGATTAFNLLVAAGALSTCACWLLVPLLNSAIDTNPEAPLNADP